MRAALRPPTVLFSNNHLLVVNKPPGWSSIPKKEEPEKSLLDHLILRQLGGGSQNDFLIPLHRIDQPCSGVVIFAKTSKAASRVTQMWKKEMVEKTYLCVLEEPLDVFPRHANKTYSNPQQYNQSKNDWNLLEGWMHKGKTKGSVKIQRHPSHDTAQYNRRVSLEWRIASTQNKNNNDASLRMVQVRTKMGTRHMVRALLASILGHSIAGDLRYRAREALPDQSVALHAQSVRLPDSFTSGSLEQQTFFEAPLPSTWKKYFGIQPVKRVHR